MPGSYSVTSAVADSRTDPVYDDWVDDAHVFEVLPPRDTYIYEKPWVPVEITVPRVRLARVTPAGRPTGPAAA